MTGLDNINVTKTRRLVVCIALLLATTLAMNLLSALIRHQEAGLGCADWPMCYAVIDRSVAPASTVDAAAYALTPTATFKRAHRVIATLLVVLVLVIVYLTRQLAPLPGFGRFLPQLLVAVVLLLAMIGPASYRKTLPAIATINLLGGMAMLALGYWLWRAVRAVPKRDGPVRLAWWALGLVIVQVALGGWTSTNFAGIACTGLTQCPGAESTGAGMSAFSFWRELALDDGGRVIMDNGQLFIQGAHRIVALLCAATVGALGVSLWRRGGAFMPDAIVLFALLALQIGLGIAGATQALPLPVVLAHNGVASLLLVMVLRAVLSSRAT
jgi:cytochrome c oxidase assembly protein subunit 15